MSITGVKYVLWICLYFCNIGGLVFKFEGSVVFYPLYWCMGEFSGHQMNSPVRIEIACYSRDTFYKMFCVQVWSYRIDKMFHAYLVSCWLFLSVSRHISGGKLETIIRKLRRDTVRYILFICYEASIKDGSVRRQYNDRAFYLGGLRTPNVVGMTNW